MKIDRANKSTCSECARATFDYQQKNLSIDGEPTLLSCPHHKYKLVVDSMACSEFQPRQNINKQSKS